MKKSREGGFIELIVVIIIALVALKYFFDFSVFEFISTPEGKDLLDYLGQIFSWLKQALLDLFSYIH